MGLAGLNCADGVDAMCRLHAHRWSGNSFAPRPSTANELLAESRTVEATGASR
jgi:hypothetical protein